MKEILSGIIVLLLFHVTTAQTINISTGLSAPNTNEPNWKVGTYFPATGTPFIRFLSSAWQTEPNAGSGARWIIPSPANSTGQTDYYYERLFSVGNGKKWLKYDFQIAADDVLKSIEMVMPDNSIKNILYTTTASYNFTRQIIDSISCPAAGEYKLRIKVFCADPAMAGQWSGLLVFGTVKLIDGTCDQIKYDACCPPWNKKVFSNMLQYSGSGSVSNPYTLLLQLTNGFKNQMQAYINYLSTINPAYTGITIVFGAHNQGNVLPAPGTYATNQVGGLTWVTWNAGGTGNPVFSPSTGPNQILGAGFPLQVGNWYSINSGIFLQNGQRYFPKTCDDNIIYIRIQVLANKSASGGNTKPLLEIGDGKGNIQSIPLESIIKPGNGRG